jgi:hypothetical protein
MKIDLTISINHILTSLSKLKKTEREMFDIFLEETQFDVLSFKDMKDTYTPSLMGDKLRITGQKH